MTSSLMLAQYTLTLPKSLDLHAMIPELVMAILILVSLLLELGEGPRSGERPAIATLVPVTVAILIGWMFAAAPATGIKAFGGMIVDDTLFRASAAVILIAVLLVSLAADSELQRHGVAHIGEYYALLLSAALGMMLMAAAGNLIVIFLGLELFSLALYLLCIFFPRESRSQESGLKYFVLSSTASAVMLYGMAMVYGATGSTWLSEIHTVANATGAQGGGLLLTVGMVLLAAGLAFKLAAVPLHMWAPDVYQGAPTSVTAFMSVATKTAALAAIVRIYVGAFGPLSARWMVIFWALAVMSIFMGNLLALAQTDIKRLLAYSGVAHAGYLLLGPLSVSDTATAAMLFYLVAYAFMNVGAFLAVLAIEQAQEGDVTLDSVRGLAARSPFLAAAFSFCLIGLTGLPPTGGFLAKYYLFGEALRSGHALLVVIGIVGSLIGAYYYLGVVARIYGPGSETRQPLGAVPTWIAMALCLSVLGVLVTGIWAAPVLQRLAGLHLVVL